MNKYTKLNGDIVEHPLFLGLPVRRKAHCFSVLVMLLRYANYKTGECYPRLSTIAKPLGLSNVTVYKCINTMIEGGILLKERLPSTNLYRIKNPKAQRTKAAMLAMKKVDHVYALSGTPIPNRPIELWPILHGLGIYRGGWFDFAARYAKMWSAPWGLDTSGASNLVELKELMKPHVLRRKKENIFKDYKEPQTQKGRIQFQYWILWISFRNVNQRRFARHVRYRC